MFEVSSRSSRVRRAASHVRRVGSRLGEMVARAALAGGAMRSHGSILYRVGRRGSRAGFSMCQCAGCRQRPAPTEDRYRFKRAVSSNVTTRGRPIPSRGGSLPIARRSPPRKTRPAPPPTNPTQGQSRNPPGSSSGERDARHHLIRPASQPNASAGERGRGCGHRVTRARVPGQSGSTRFGIIPAADRPSGVRGTRVRRR
jgi:hypothetical protein